LYENPEITDFEKY